MLAGKLPIRVFVAAPSDLGAERAILSSIVEGMSADPISAEEFTLVDWTQVPGTVGRPQDAINEVIQSCDYMICMFKAQWGTDPGGDTYSSGTEEEFFNGLISLGVSDKPLKDIWLVFVSTSSQEPDQQICDLRSQIEKTHTVLYGRAHDSEEFRKMAQNRLQAWSSYSARKAPRSVGLVTSKGKDVLGAFQLLRNAGELAAMGETARAEQEFIGAIEVGGANERLAYGQFLRRQGRFDEASEQGQKAVDDLLNEPSDPMRPQVAEAKAFLASLLKSQGQLREAEIKFASALEWIPEDPQSVLTRCKILDELGIVRQNAVVDASKRRDSAEMIRLSRTAQEAFDESLKLREKYGLGAPSIAQSKVNLARLKVAQNDFASAVEYADSAVGLVEQFPPSELKANCILARAQARLRLAKDSVDEALVDELERGAVNDAEMALAINREMKSIRTIALCLNVHAQALYRRGDVAGALDCAHECRVVNDEMHTDPPSFIKWLLSNYGG